jgi:hypothetical protein
MTKLKEFVKIISPENEDRLRIRITTDTGKVVNIMVQYEARINDSWYEIVRYDCAHGFLHRDVMWPTKTEKQMLDIKNLDAALQFAEQDIKDRWKWYKERFKKRLKK